MSVDNLPVTEPEGRSNDVLENVGSSIINANSRMESVSGSHSEPRSSAGRRGISFAPGTISPSTSSQSYQRRLKSQKKKQNVNANSVANMKKENLVLLIQKKKECEKKAQEIVMRLIDPKVEKEYLFENAIRISKQHMDDVIEERRLSELCGWVLCDNRLDLNNVPKQTYKIYRHKVYDITERKSFCCGKCYAKATHFKAQLMTSPLWLRDMEEDVHFEILEDHETKELHGLSVSFSSVTLSDEEEEEEAENDNVKSFTDDA